MDFNILFTRVKNLLMTPKTEWPVIAAEPATISSIYTKFIVVMAAVPAVIGFVKGSIIGYSIPFVGTTMRLPMSMGITGMVVQYAAGLLGAFLFALIVDALAPTFGGQKNRVQALKAAAYTATPVYVASILQILPVLGAVAILAGLVYAIYQLYIALQATMKAPQDKAVGYTAVSILVAIVAAVLLNMVLGAIGFGFGGRGMMGAMGAAAAARGAIGATADSDGMGVIVDPKGAAGQVSDWAKRMQAAGAAAEAAQKSGSSQAAAQAATAAIATALGGDPNTKALSTDQLKSFVPATLLGMKRTDLEANRGNAVGVQTAEVEARYSADNSKSVRLKIQDLAFANGLMALGSKFGVESEHSSDDGIEKSYTENGRWIQESWNNKSNSGKYSLMLGERFNVEVEGDAGSLAELKGAVATLNLSGLEALKNEGRKAPQSAGADAINRGGAPNRR